MTMMNRNSSRNHRGYILLSVMLLMTIMLLTLTIEAPRIAQQIKREKEEELIHRGNEYKSAIKKYFRKFGRYPVSLEQLENTNNMRFLRKRYNDPFTGKDDWRLLHVGEVQLSPLPGGVAGPGQQLGQPIGGSIGQPVGGNAGSPFSSSPNQPAGQTGTTPSQNQSGAVGGNSSGLLSGSGSSGSTTQFGGGAVMGVASTSKSSSIKEIDGKNHYNDWFFVYDPRLDQRPGVPGAPGAGIPGATPIGQPLPGQQQPPVNQQPPGVRPPDNRR